LTERFRNLVYGAALTLMIGWVLHLGRGIIVPVVSAALIVYVIMGLARFLELLPWVGRTIPGWVRNLFSILLILAVLAAIVLMMITNVNQVANVMPHYAERLLAIVQGVAAYIGIETQPTWTTLRDEVMEQIDLRTLIGTAVASVGQIVSVFVVVLIYAGFLLAERGTFPVKLGAMSQDADTLAEVRAVLGEINQRIGRYLALKTFVNVVLGLVSYAMMALVGVEFAGFWAVLIGLLNYIPYLGSFLGVLFPVVLSALQFDDVGVVLLVLAVLTAAQMMVGNFLEPYLLGNSLNLSPFVILVSLAIWYALWGIPGAILSVPITASLVIVLSVFRGTRPIAVLLSRNGQVGDVTTRVPAQKCGG
jgi:AI-2 transport protein TqsA